MVSDGVFPPIGLWGLSSSSVWKQELDPYHTTITRLIQKFYFFEIDHALRSNNAQTYALTKLTATTKLPPKGEVSIIIKHRRLMSSALDDESGLTIYEVHNLDSEEEDWHEPIIKN